MSSSGIAIGVAIIMLSGAVIPASTQQNEPGAGGELFERIQSEFAEAYNRKDVTAMAAFFSENAVRITPAGIFRGLDASILNLNARDRGHYAMRYVATLRWAAELELGRDSLRLAMESAKDSLSVLAKYCPVIDIDPATARITRFRAYATSTAWRNGPAPGAEQTPLGKFKIVYALIEGNDAVSRNVPPGFASSTDYLDGGYRTLPR